MAGVVQRRGLFLLFLLAVVPAAIAMPIADLAEPQSIAGQWKFKLGDELAWAAPDFDDRNWQQTRVPAHSPEGHAGYSGMLWYRLTLQLDLSKPSVRNSLGALAVTLGKVLSAYEVYAGGTRLGGVGSLPPTPESVNDRHATWSVPASAVSTDGRLVIALRVWRNPDVVKRWQTGPYGGDFLIGNDGSLRALEMRKALLPSAVLAVLYFVLGMYHLLIARRNPVLKEFFWFGLLGIVLAFYTFETSQSKYLLDISFGLHKRFEHLLLYISPILFSNTLLAVTHTGTNLAVRGFNVIFGLIFLTALVLPDVSSLSLTLTTFQFLVPVWGLYMAGLMTWRAYYGSRSARVIVVLLLVLVAGVINDELLQNALIGSGDIMYIVFALVLFCMALLMAERYTTILKELESAVQRRTSQLTEANRELAVAAEIKGNFLANMSHEMRTPMNAILGLTRLGLQTELTEQQRDYFGKVEQSAEGLQDIIDSILDFSKLQDGQLECVNEPFEPAAMADSIRRIWHEGIEEAGLELQIDVDPGIPELVIGDAKRIRQVLGIFISNAAKFTDDGHVRVNIELQNRDGQSATLRFAVTDTGPGIAEDMRGHLFEAFAQADNSMTRKHGGTGLGLSIAQRLVELMGGDIDVDSTVGKGSTFSFKLDLPIPAEDTVTDGREGQLDLAPIRGARVLLVDDSALNLQVAGELLRQAKLYVETAMNGREAVDKATSAHFDCVLMDVQMPVMDGYTATERIRSKPHLAELPVLAMTANAMQQDRARGAEAGMNAYIPKPIEPDELYRALLQWIEPGDREYDEKRFEAAAVGGDTDADLPDAMPGLDISSGLKRVAGNKALYLSLLKDLCTDYADVADRLQSMLDNGDTDGARQLAHKLRGIANNLGAERTGIAAEAIELPIKSGEELAQDAIPNLVAAIAEVAESQAVLAPLMATEAADAELDDAQRNALFDDVKQAVAESNPEALDLVEKLLAGMSQDAAGYAELSATRDALDIYDFAGAVEQLEAAAQSGGFA